MSLKHTRICLQAIRVNHEMVVENNKRNSQWSLSYMSVVYNIRLLCLLCYANKLYASRVIKYKEITPSLKVSVNFKMISIRNCFECKKNNYTDRIITTSLINYTELNTEVALSEICLLKKLQLQL